MNPKTTVRLWLLACGKQYGINNAYLINATDAAARGDQGPYFVYKLVSYASGQVGHHDQSEADEYTAVRGARKRHLATIQVDLFDSQDGLYELASMCVALESDPTIKAIFDNQAEFQEMTQCVDLSTRDGLEFYYHQQMLCTFEINVEFELEEANAIVETILLQTEVDGPIFKITEDGYGFTKTITAETGALIAFGEATFVEA